MLIFSIVGQYSTRLNWIELGQLPSILATRFYDICANILIILSIPPKSQLGLAQKSMGDIELVNLHFWSFHAVFAVFRLPSVNQ